MSEQESDIEALKTCKNDDDDNSSNQNPLVKLSGIATICFGSKILPVKIYIESTNQLRWGHLTANYSLA